MGVGTSMLGIFKDATDLIIFNYMYWDVWALVLVYFSVKLVTESEIFIYRG